MARSKIYSKIDWKVVGCYLFLILFGWINIYSSSGGATEIFDFSTNYGKQIIWIGSAFALAAIILFAVPHRVYSVFAWLIYGFVIVLLAAVIFIGTEVNGSKSWLELGPVRLQPAEFSKIATALALATVMGKYGFKFRRFKDAIKAFAVMALPMLLIVMEKETGSALVYAGFLLVLYREGMSGWVLIFGIGAIVLFILTLAFSPFISILALLGVLMLFYAFMNRRPLPKALCGAAIVAALSFIDNLFSLEGVRSFVPEIINSDTVLAAICIVAAVVLIFISLKKKWRIVRKLAFTLVCGVGLIFSVDFIFDNILQEHQRGRIETLLGIKEDIMGVGYNVHQSLIAIGSGGFGGKGFLQGTQTRFDFVPEQSTDFIFCTIGEEWGFVGALAIIAAYLTIIISVFNSAEKQKESFARIYGYGVASCILMHVVINICMTIGLMPVIGIPLPFLSYGGSSLWAFTILLFIYLRLDMERWR